MKKYNLAILILVFINYSCKLENKTNGRIESSSSISQKTSSVKTDDYLSVSDIDVLPVFKYNNLRRPIQPALTYIAGKPHLLRDSLVSVFLEDNLLNQIIESEGIIIYKLKLHIDNQGYIKKVEFMREDYNKDDYGISQLPKYIVSDLRKIKLVPAKKKGKDVPISILIGVRIDLYNNPSDFRKKLFPDK